MKKTAGYPQDTHFINSLAHKVITRVVSDGQSLKNSIREAIKVAELNQQDTFHLLAVLDDMGMVHNGDFKNYWVSGIGEEVGGDSFSAGMGTNYYASSKGKTVTADLEGSQELLSLFQDVEMLKGKGFTDDDITNINPDLAEIVSVVTSVNERFAEQDWDVYDETEGEDDEQDDDDDETTSDAFVNSFIASGSMKFAQANGGSGLLAYIQEAKQRAKKGTAFDEALRQVLAEGGMDPQRAPHIVDFFRNKGVDIPEYSEKDPTSTLQPVAEKAQKIKNLRGLRWEDAINEAAVAVFGRGMHLPSADVESIKRMVGASVEDRIVVAQVEEEADDLDAALEGLDEAPAEEAPIEEPPVEEGEDELAGLEEDLGGDTMGEAVSVEATPSPSELLELVESGPDFEIENLLSISKAEQYFKALKDSLEEVVYNKNIKMDMETVAEYDKARSSIDEKLDRIKEAAKGKEKLESKEQELEDEVTEEEIPEEEIPEEMTSELPEEGAGLGKVEEEVEEVPAKL